MGLGLGFALLTGLGSAAVACLLVQEALRMRRFRRKYAAALLMVLAVGCIVYTCGAIAIAAAIMDFGGLFDLLPSDLY